MFKRLASGGVRGQARGVAWTGQVADLPMSYAMPVAIADGTDELLQETVAGAVSSCAVQVLA